jgi:O-acetylserine/cysteine efflux transporter
LFGLSALTEHGQFASLHDATWRAWAAVAFTSLVASLMAHSGMYYLIRRYPVTSVSPITVLATVFGVFFGVTLLGDRLTSRMVAGGIICLVGVVIVASRGKRIVDTAT